MSDHRRRIGPFLSETKQKYVAAWPELLTELYDIPDYYHSKTKTQGRYELKRPFVGLLACSTLEWIDKHLDEDMIAGGFLPRFLFWGCPPDHETGGMPSQVDTQCGNWVRKLLREVDGRQYDEITIDDCAAAVYEKWIAGVENRMRLTNDAVRAFWGRMNASAIKVAILYAIANGQLSIDEEVLQPAIRLMEWHQQTSVEFLDKLAPSRFAKQLKRVMEIVRRHGDGKPVPRRDIVRYAKFPPRELNDALTTLVQGGQLASRDGPKGGVGYIEVSN